MTSDSRSRSTRGRSGSTGRRRRRRRHHRRRLWLIWGAIAGFVVVSGAVVAGIFATQVLEVRDDLEQARASLSRVAAALDAGDTAALQSIADDVDARTGHAEEVVSGELWSLASAVPVVGANVSAVRDVTFATSILAADALPPALATIANLSGRQASVDGGGLDLEPFRAAMATLPEISDAVHRADELISGIDRAGLVGPVEEAIGEFADVITAAAPAIEGVEQSLPTLLSMAGSDEPRSYLVLFQNNAEVRATGGNPSAMAYIRVDDGRIELARQATAATFYDEGTAGVAPTALPPETTALYESDTLLYLQNYTRSPHFPTTALLTSSLWQKTFDDPIDGVVSLDPVVLGYALAVTGPVTLADGTAIASDDVVDVLLRQVYEKLGDDDGRAADAYFASVVERVFGALIGGRWDPLEMFEALSHGADENRVNVWMQRPDEQRIVSDAGLSGALSDPSGTTHEVGVYVNDASHSKLEYYLDSEVAVSCDRAAGTVTTTITLRNGAPASGLNGYVRGQRNHVYGFGGSTMLLDVLFFAPAGSEVRSTDPAAGDIRAWDREGVEEGRRATSLAVAVEPGGSRQVSFTADLVDDGRGLAVSHTPGIRETPVVVAPECA